MQQEMAICTDSRQGFLPNYGTYIMPHLMTIPAQISFVSHGTMRIST